MTARPCHAAAATAVLTALCLAGCEGERDANGSAAGQGNREAVEPPEGAPGTFTPSPAARAAADDQSRLPAPGDRTLYVPATELFPGSARRDPMVENPFSGNQQAIDAGRRHFSAFNCAGCHAPLGGGGMGPPLSDDVWIYGGEPAQVYLSIMHGRPQGMPAWSSMLPEKTAWELVAYIETLPGIEDPAATKGFESSGSPSASGNGSGPDSTSQ